jgi:hypothetical protein
LRRPREFPRAFRAARWEQQIFTRCFEPTRATRLGSDVESRFWISYRPYEARDGSREGFIGPALTWLYSQNDSVSGIYVVAAALAVSAQQPASVPDPNSAAVALGDVRSLLPDFKLKDLRGTQFRPTTLKERWSLLISGRHGAGHVSGKCRITKNSSIDMALRPRRCRT